MNVKKLTEAAVLCSTFVTLSIVAISLGFSYLGYIDFIVPIFIAIIYFKCGLRYSILSSISSFILVIFMIGNVPSGIMMIQSMVLGIILAILIDKSRLNIFDDLLITSISGCFIMIIMDINFSSLTGYSILQESEEIFNQLSNFFNQDVSQYKDTIYYMSISILPLGTGIICYIGTIFIGKRFKCLNKYSYKKWYLLRNYKKYSPLLYITKNTFIFCLVYLGLFSVVEKLNLIINFTYLRILLHCINYIIIFFLLQDSYLMCNRFVYSISKTRTNLLIFQIFTLILLSIYFKIIILILIFSNILIDKKFNVKLNNKEIIEKIIIN